MILMLGDVHGYFKHVLPIVQKLKPAAIIFLGDMDLDRPFEHEVAEVMKLTELYFIHGNHDTDSADKHDYLFNSSLADRNLHGRVIEIDGHKVAGLGGVFRQSIWWPKNDANTDSNYDNYEAYIEAEMQASRWQEIRRQKALGNDFSAIESPELVGKRLTHKSTIFYDDWLKLFSQQADILVTHEAPDCHPYGFSGITELAKSMKVKHSFHGHHHDRLDYSAHTLKMGFEAHGVGLRGISDLNGMQIRPGDVDHMKTNRKQNIDE